MKKTFLVTLLLIAVAANGCVFKKHQAAASPAVTAPKTIVTPDLSLAAKVVSVNTVGRFAVLNFPADRMPKPGQTFFLYRDGLKVAEVKITGPQQQNNIVADLVSGDAKAGDTVRDE
jgi:hypothetical protein